MAQTLIGGRWRLETGRPLGGVGGGLPAFAAIDMTDEGGPPAMALRVARDAPARAGMLTALERGGPVAGVLMPLAWGVGAAADGEIAGWLICPSPLVPPVIENLRPWAESDILDRVMKPVAAALEALRSRGVTHRAIRPNNVFAEARGPALLGCAWAAPPALHQPAVFEPPYSAACPPAARGDGGIADDVYALAVLMLTLALGRVPMAALEPEQALRRKLELGSYAALTEGERLPPILADLARGMLAEDPDHRPPPALLADPAAARARRVTARPPRRAQRALEIGGQAHWHTRTAALACARHPADALSRLQSGEMEGWLRRALGDAGLASEIEEAVRRYRQETRGPDQGGRWRLLLRTIATLDPLLPPCWQGMLVWPDGVGPALAAEPGAEPLVDLIDQEGLAVWASVNRPESTALRLEARRWRSFLQGASAALGAARLRYALNPLLPCGGWLGEHGWIAELRDVLPALERLAGEQTRPPAPVDTELAAFIAARLDNAAESTAALAIDGKTQPALAQLRLLGLLQQRLGPPSLPGLAGWLAKLASPILEAWPSRLRREGAKSQLDAAVAQGRVTALLTLLDDRVADQAERARLEEARRLAAEIDAAIADLAAAAPQRRARAEALGQACASGLGALALAASILMTVL